MKFIKKICLSIFFIFLLSIVAIWGITQLLQPETFKLFAKKQLSHLTHQDSAIEGEISWRILPRPGLHLTKVRIGDVNKIDGDYALAVDDLTFHLQLMPLLHGQLVFDKLILDGFTLRINLGAQKTQVSSKKTPSPPTKINTLPTYVALKSFLLTNGEITIQQPTSHFSLKQVRLEAALPNNAHEQFPIQLKAILQKKSAGLSLDGHLSYKGLLQLPPLDTGNFQLENLTLDGQTTFQNIHLNAYEIIKANAHTLYQQGTLSLNPLTLSLYNGKSVGQLTYQLKTNELRLNQSGTELTAEPIFKPLLETLPTHLTGTLDFSIQAKAQLNTPNWHKKMQSNGSITLHNGKLTSIDLPALTTEAAQTLKAFASQNIEHIQQVLEQLKPWNLNDYTGSTDFLLFNLQYQTSGNDMLNYQLLLETPQLNLKGEGALNLNNETIKARLMAYVMTPDKTTHTIQQLLGHGFPLLVTGTLSHPVINADLHTIRTHLLSNDGLPH